MSAAPARKPAGRGRRFLVGTLAFVAITLGTVALVEGGVSALLFARDYRRVGLPRPQLRPHLAHDSLLGWANRPGFASPDEYGAGVPLTITPEGFRGTPAVADARASLVCSGDAFTMGYGVDDAHTWCARLQALLPGLRTYDMGQLQYGLDQVYLWYRRDGARVPHQVQLLALTEAELERAVSGDVAGRSKPYVEVEGGKLVTRNVPVPPQSAEALRRATRESKFDDLRVVQAARMLPAFDERRQAIEAVDRRWPAFERMLTELADLHQSRGTTLVLAYLPTARDARGGAREGWRRRIAAFAKQRDVQFIDLAPALRALRPDSADLAYISRPAKGAAPGVGGQLSNIGHVWVARHMAERLVSLPALAAVASR